MVPLCSFLCCARASLPSLQVKELEAQLTELSHSILAVLTLALQYGPVTVITNAETGWVQVNQGTHTSDDRAQERFLTLTHRRLSLCVSCPQLSAQKFIPLVVPMLAKLTVISARSTYEPMFPGR